MGDDAGAGIGILPVVAIESNGELIDGDGERPIDEIGTLIGGDSFPIGETGKPVGGDPRCIDDGATAPMAVNAIGVGGRPTFAFGKPMETSGVDAER